MQVTKTSSAITLPVASSSAPLTVIRSASSSTTLAVSEASRQCGRSSRGQPGIDDHIGVVASVGVVLRQRLGARGIIGGKDVKAHDPTGNAELIGCASKEAGVQRGEGLQWLTPLHAFRVSSRQFPDAIGGAPSGVANVIRSRFSRANVQKPADRCHRPPESGMLPDVVYPRVD
jgi:hypothetical protein